MYRALLVIVLFILGPSAPRFVTADNVQVAPANPQDFVPPGETREIALLGNSITAGFLSESNYGVVLQDSLGGQYDVRNYGVGGARLLKSDAMSIWDTDAFADLLASTPDSVTVMLGTNDAGAPGPAPIPDDLNEQFEADLIDLVQTLQALSSSPQVYLAYPPPAYNISESADEIIREDLIPIIDRVAGDFLLPVVDTYNGVIDYEANWPDGLHPNADGDETLANLFESHLLAVHRVDFSFDQAIQPTEAIFILNRIGATANIPRADLDQDDDIDEFDRDLVISALRQVSR